MGMCGMQGDVNGDIPGAPSPRTTAENDRSERGGGGGGKGGGVGAGWVAKGGGVEF